MPFPKVTKRLRVTDLRGASEFSAGTLGFRIDQLWPVDAPPFLILEQDEVSEADPWLD